jgi:hypothetical protein
MPQKTFYKIPPISFGIAHAGQGVFIILINRYYNDIVTAPGGPPARDMTAFPDYFSRY